MRGKPIKFAYKFWCLFSSSGYLYNFLPYLGKENQTSNESLGIRVIQNLTSVIPEEEAVNHEIFFDNFFTSIYILKALGHRNLKATGTIRQNRTKKCPLIPSKVMKKTKEREFVDYGFDHTSKVPVTKWHDNTPVSVATNYSAIFRTGHATRY